MIQNETEILLTDYNTGLVCTCDRILVKL